MNANQHLLFNSLVYKIATFFYQFSAGINNSAAERQAAKEIMDLIGEKFRETIGTKRDPNSFIHPLRMVERRAMFQTNSRTEIERFNS